jgi:hypothetical protein
MQQTMQVVRVAAQDVIAANYEEDGEWPQIGDTVTFEQDSRLHVVRVDAEVLAAAKEIAALPSFNL